MPAVVVAELRYDKKRDVFFVYLYQLLNRLQVIQDGHYIYGKLDSCYIDKKIRKDISKPMELRIKNGEGTFDYKSGETIREAGITPNSWVCLVLEHYSRSGRKYDKYPIYPDHFEIIEVPDALRGEIETRFKGAEEILRLLEMSGVIEELKEGYEHLQNAYIKFQANFFEDSKTSARKTLEIIREIVRSWKTIDGSGHLADGMKKLVSNLYTLSSTGGPHRGVATRDETEVILYTLLYLFKYINKVVKEQRVEIGQETAES